jgi:hypothetical protein
MDWIWRVPLQFAITELALQAGDAEKACREAELTVRAAAMTPEPTWHGLATWYSARAKMAGRNVAAAREELSQALNSTAVQPTPLAKWPLKALTFELTGDVQARADALEIVRRLAEPLDKADPAKASLLASSRVTAMSASSR